MVSVALSHVFHMCEMVAYHVCACQVHLSLHLEEHLSVTQTQQRCFMTHLLTFSIYTIKLVEKASI